MPKCCTRSFGLSLRPSDFSQVISFCTQISVLASATSRRNLKCFIVALHRAPRTGREDERRFYTAVAFQVCARQAPRRANCGAHMSSPRRSEGSTFYVPPLDRAPTTSICSYCSYFVVCRQLHLVDFLLEGNSPRNAVDAASALPRSSQGDEASRAKAEQASPRETSRPTASPRSDRLASPRVPSLVLPPHDERQRSQTTIPKPLNVKLPPPPVIPLHMQSSAASRSSAGTPIAALPPPTSKVVRSPRTLPRSFSFRPPSSHNGATSL